MVTKHERHISYICPACNSVTTRLIDPFAFSGRKSITVTCSKKDCEITCVHIHDHEGTYVIEAFCTLCGSIHSTTISKRHFWNNPLTSLTCDVSGIDMLFIGESDTIKAAWEVFEQKCREFEEDDYGFFDDFEPDTDDDTLAENLCSALEVLELLDESGYIQCSCGSHNISFTVIDNKIGLKCSHCRSISIKEPSEEFLRTLATSVPYIFNS